MPWTFLIQPSRIYLSIKLFIGTSFSTSCCWCSHLAVRPLIPKCCRVQRSHLPSLFFCLTINEINCSYTSLLCQTSGTTLPFTMRSAWLTKQPESPDLRRKCAYIRQGTCTSRKATNIKAIKCYLNVATIASDGLFVVKRKEPFAPAKEPIIIRRSVLHGLLTSGHLQLSHPSAKQMRIVIKLGNGRSHW